MRQLYGTDQLASQLRAGAVLLNATQNPEAQQLGVDFLRLVGEIEGTTRTLDSANRKPKTRAVSATIVEENYFTSDFLNEAALRARNALDLLIYRNIQISNVFYLEKLQTAARRGVTIRILALASHAPDYVLTEATRLMPRPIPPDGSALREQLRSNEDQISRIVSEQWSDAERSRFEYRRYTIVPGLHFARIDSSICTGFIGTIATVQPARYEDRPYLELPDRSRPGRILSQHFEALWTLSQSNSLVPKTRG